MKKIDVIIIDDEKNVLNSLRRLFRDETFGIFFTVDHREAARILEQNTVKVVMSDQKMPKITGVEFLRTVKENHPRVINILFTGYADLKIATEAINKGEVYRFINKPWDDTDLKIVVKQALNKYDLEEENRELAENIKKQNEKLKKLYEAQKSFTLMVSHELRTPLATMLTAVDFVSKTGGIKAREKNLLGKVSNSIKRLNRLIDDVLELSKLEFEKVNLKIGAYQINEIIEEVVLTQKPIAEKYGLYLKTELDDTFSKVKFDPDRVIQVLNNLINNAIKFTSRGGITVKSHFDGAGKNIIVSVIDTGMGIDKEDIPELFKKFKQLANASAKRTKGTGLGLAICKEIIDQHGGKIWAVSGAGKGSSFNFSLPYVSD